MQTGVRSPAELRLMDHHVDLVGLARAIATGRFSISDAPVSADLFVDHQPALVRPFQPLCSGNDLGIVYLPKTAALGYLGRSADERIRVSVA